MKRWLDKHKWLLLVLVLAAGLRLFGLTTSPPSLYWEEVALGYDAYSILKTGRDHHGNFLPVVAFESFGDWKPALYFYLIVPLLPIFGLSAEAVRLPAALAGIVTVFLVYLIARRLKFSEMTALLSAAALAILPWHLQFSRAGFEVTVAVMWLCLGVYLILRSKDQTKWLLLAAASLVLSMYTYHGLRVLAPFMGVFTLILFTKQWWREKYVWLTGLLALVLLLPLLISFNSPQIQQRVNETSFWSVSDAVEIANQRRAEDDNTVLARLIHHRYWLWAREIAANVLSHFNLNFLFLSGDGNLRHQTGYMALLYHWMIVPLLYGLVLLFKRKQRTAWFLVGWVLLAALPSALTKDAPHSLRFLAAAPAIAILIGYGLSALIDWMRTRKYKWAYLMLGVIIIAGSWLAYTFDYFVVYPQRSSQDWQYGYEQVMDYVLENQIDYEHVFITRNLGRPVMYYFFHGQIDPALVQVVEPDVVQDQGELLEFGEVTFGEHDGSANSLVVVDEAIEGSDVLLQINYLNGEPALYVYQI